MVYLEGSTRLDIRVTYDWGASRESENYTKHQPNSL